MKRRKNRTIGICAGLVLCITAGIVWYWLTAHTKQPADTAEAERKALEETAAENTPQEESIADNPAEKESPEDAEEIPASGPSEAVPDIPPKEPEPTPEELLTEQVEAVLADMTREEKVLQLFMITPEALTGHGTVTEAKEKTQEAILSYPVGGLVYFAKNLKEPEQVRTMLGNTLRYYEEAGSPVPFLGVDEEGGKVARIGGQPAFDVERIPDMRTVGDQTDAREAERIGRVIGSYLSELGFNVDFAPCADVLTEPENQVIGRRSFGTDPKLVAELALAEVKGLEESGVFAVLKHYPGHGATKSDSHDGYAYTDKGLEELMEAELVPFERGVQEGVHFIMAAHISVPSVTGDPVPCTLSPYMITDVLRGRYGYDGIVVTDAMNMGAIRQQYGSAEAAVLALQAGVDLILMPSDFVSAYEGVLAALDAGELSEERIDESVRRILRVKLTSLPGSAAEEG